MRNQIIGIKQLHKELKKISESALAGNSFIIVKNSKPVFRIEPIAIKQKRKFSIGDLKKLEFRSGDKNLSKKIDTIAYHV